MEIGTIDSLYSNVLKDSREYYVHLPESFNASSKRDYPVFYVLDGDFIMNATTPTE